MLCAHILAHVLALGTRLFRRAFLRTHSLGAKQSSLRGVHYILTGKYIMYIPASLQHDRPGSVLTDQNAMDGVAK